MNALFQFFLPAECEGKLQEIAGKNEEHKIGVDAFLKKERAIFL